MRRKFTETERRRFFAELDRSGESAGRVARRLGLNARTAYRWAASRTDDGPTFARVVRSADTHELARFSSIAIEVGAARIVIEAEFDPKLLRGTRPANPSSLVAQDRVTPLASKGGHDVTVSKRGLGGAGSAAW